MNFNQEWTADAAADLYHLDRWGLGYFQIDEEGFVVACPNGHASRAVRIVDVIQDIQKQGISPPMLVRFPGIIQHRVTEINRVFREAIDEFEFQGEYHGLFPVKVNQHREVIQATIQAGKRFGGGMEAGSKAELLAVIAMADNQMPILCNGFKDETVIELALRASKLGRQITIVIEKPNEIELIARHVQRFEIKPKLGIRIKLSSRVAEGHWRDSSGQRSKFGLTVPELVAGIQQLREYDLLNQLHLLHFHPGSQINSVRKIKSSLTEATRVYVDLVEKGVPLDTIDVGGGLAVDYTGQRNRNPSSMNYTLREYANDVVYYIGKVCDEAGVSHPTIFSESGRALTAHHSMVVVPVIGTSHSNVDRVKMDIASVETDLAPLSELLEIKSGMRSDNLLECFHDTQVALETALQLFSTGHLSLDQRALAEWLAHSIYVKINGLLSNLDFVAPELENLRYQLADTYFGNFSVFQALPDSWALNQVFPVMPIHRLNQRPQRFGMLGDLTCDSDGKVDCFIGPSAERKWLPLHELKKDGDRAEPYYIGIFLVGAYQEALSDDHNLMGKFHIVSVDQSLQAKIVCAGSNLKEVLEHTHHDYNTIMSELQTATEDAVAAGRLSSEEGMQTLDCYQRVSLKYTYLEEGGQENELALPETSERNSSLATNPN